MGDNCRFVTTTQPFHITFDSLLMYKRRSFKVQYLKFLLLLIQFGSTAYVILENLIDDQLTAAGLNSFRVFM